MIKVENRCKSILTTGLGNRCSYPHFTEDDSQQGERSLLLKILHSVHCKAESGSSIQTQLCRVQLERLLDTFWVGPLVYNTERRAPRPVGEVTVQGLTASA